MAASQVLYVLNWFPIYVCWKRWGACCKTKFKHMIAWEISWRPRERIIRRGFLFPHGTGSRTRTTFLGVGVLAPIPGNAISQTGERVKTVYLEGRVKEQIFPHIVKQFGLLQLPIYTISNTMTWLKQNEKKKHLCRARWIRNGKEPVFYHVLHS